MMQYHNPVLPGFHPDPSICRSGSDYYLAVSSFEYFPGVPVYHSRNLVNWELEGYALSRVSQLLLSGCAPSAGIYAPVLRYAENRFYMVTTNTSAEGHLLVSAEHAAGPWSDPVMIRQSGIDPSLLFDGDTVYFCCNNLGAEGKQGIFLSEIDVHTGETLTKPVCISFGSGGRYVEAPHLYHIGTNYYLMLSEGGTEYGHMVTAFRAASPYGPYEACPHNPILTHRNAGGNPIQATGHADLVETEDGHWWMVCLGIRPQPGLLLHHLGRETFLAPVEWDSSGWPHVNRDRLLTENMEGFLPARPEVQKADYADPFVGACRPEWRTLREPLEAPYKKITSEGLLLTGNGTLLSEECGTPAFLGIPQRCFRMRCEVQVRNSGEGDLSAGLSMFYGADYHADLILQVQAGKSSLHFRKRFCDTESDTEVLKLPDHCAFVRLFAEADAKTYRFYAEPVEDEEEKEAEAEKEADVEVEVEKEADVKEADVKEADVKEVEIKEEDDDGSAQRLHGAKPALLGTARTAGLSTEVTHYMSFTGVMTGIFSEKGTGLFRAFSLRELPENPAE